MKLTFLHFIISIFIISTSFNTSAQINNENFRIGFNYGSGSQDKFPFKSDQYSHDVEFYKIQLNYLLKEKRKWTFELNIEPSIYIAQHKLLNQYFIQPHDGDDYLEQREYFTEEREIKQYVLNLGLLARYNISESFSIYSLGIVGPMVSDKATERLAKGFSFSDILAFGTSYDFGNFLVDFRYSVRHTSNFEMKQPNSGHNTTNFEFGFQFKL